MHATLNGFTVTGGAIGIHGNGTDATIQNSVVRDNSWIGIQEVNGPIRDCKIKDNIGAGVSGSDGTISGCLISNNADGLYLCDGVISGCQVLNNREHGLESCDGFIQGCVVSNSGRYGLYRCNATISRTIVSGNSWGGVVSCDGSRIDNSIVAGNKSSAFGSSSLDVLNCTITGNRGFGFASHTGEIKQCIIWDNDDGALSNSTTPTLSGTVNPYFVQPGHWNNIDDVWIEGDYHVAGDSPYIDAGSPLYGGDPGDPTEDLDGNPRVVGVRVDIGAYEFQAPCEGEDFDGDGLADICDSDIDNDGVGNTLDPCDFTPFGVPVDSTGRPHADLNLDCVVDLRDFATFMISMTGP